MTSTSETASAGSSSIRSGGEMSSPSQVKRDGMSPSSSKAGDEMRMLTSSSSVAIERLLRIHSTRGSAARRVTVESKAAASRNRFLSHPLRHTGSAGTRLESRSARGASEETTTTIGDGFGSDGRPGRAAPGTVGRAGQEGARRPLSRALRRALARTRHRHAARLKLDISGCCPKIGRAINEMIAADPGFRATR